MYICGIGFVASLRFGIRIRIRILFRGKPVASPTLVLVLRFGGQSYRNLITAYSSCMLRDNLMGKA